MLEACAAAFAFVVFLDEDLDAAFIAEDEERGAPAAASSEEGTSAEAEARVARVDGIPRILLSFFLT